MKRRVVAGMASLALAWGLTACQSGPAALTDPAPPPAYEAPDAGGRSPESLLGEWQLVRVQRTGEAAVTPPPRQPFSVEFASDGRVNMVADCNRCFAEYSATPDTIEVGLAACTLALCVTAPLDTTFSGLVSAAREWSVSGEELTLSSEDGTLILQR